MTSPSLIAVTGSTGALGGRVAARLAAAGVRQRLVVRDPARAPDLPDVEIVQATYDDAGALRSAFSGADAVFLVSAAEHPERVQDLHRRFVDAGADILSLVRWSVRKRLLFHRRHPRATAHRVAPVDNTAERPQEHHRFRPRFYWVFSMPLHLDRPYKYL
jgi:nucleoside-diphosphate-sugar epimerase